MLYFLNVNNNKGVNIIHKQNKYNENNQKLKKKMKNQTMKK